MPTSCREGCALSYPYYPVPTARPESRQMMIVIAETTYIVNPAQYRSTDNTDKRFKPLKLPT